MHPRAARRAHAQSFGPLATAGVAIGGTAAVVAAAAAGMALSTYREKRATRRLRDNALDALYSTAQFRTVLEKAIPAVQHLAVTNYSLGTASAQDHPTAVNCALQMLAATLVDASKSEKDASKSEKDAPTPKAEIMSPPYTFTAQRSDDGTQLVLVASKHVYGEAGREITRDTVVVWRGNAGLDAKCGSPTGMYI